MWAVIIKVLSLFWDVDACLLIQRLVLVVIRVGSVFNVLIDETADHVDLFVADALVVVEPQDDLEGVAVKVVAFDPQFELASFGKVLAVGVWTQCGEIHVKGVDL